MKKIFDIHAAKPGRPYNAPTVDISLPAAPYELLDMQERLRAANASEVTVQITYSHTSKYLEQSAKNYSQTAGRRGIMSPR